jgi:hypothetical protein
LLTIVISLMAAIFTVLSGYIAYRSYRYGKAKDEEKAELLDEKDRVSTALENRLHPIDLRINTLEITSDHAADKLEAMLSRALQPLVTEMAALGSKMDVLWEVQKQAALDAARILHHPLEDRRMIDHLLDAFVDDTLTPEEEVQFRKYLVIIKNWKPGDNVGFPVYQGEQLAASGLLRFLTYVKKPPTDDLSKEDSDPHVEA